MECKLNRITWLDTLLQLVTRLSHSVTQFLYTSRDWPHRTTWLDFHHTTWPIPITSRDSFPITSRDPIPITSRDSISITPRDQFLSHHVTRSLSQHVTPTIATWLHKSSTQNELRIFEKFEFTRFQNNGTPAPTIPSHKSLWKTSHRKY